MSKLEFEDFKPYWRKAIFKGLVTNDSVPFNNTDTVTSAYFKYVKWHNEKKQSNQSKKDYHSIHRSDYDSFLISVPSPNTPEYEIYHKKWVQFRLQDLTSFNTFEGYYIDKKRYDIYRRDYLRAYKRTRSKTLRDSEQNNTIQKFGWYCQRGNHSRCKLRICTCHCHKEVGYYCRNNQHNQCKYKACLCNCHK